MSRSIITAAEALRLPTAQLNDEEVKEVVLILTEIDKGVREKMERAGLNITLACKKPNVIAEVAVTLKSAGWNPQFQPIFEESNIRGAKPCHVGYTLALAPGETAFEAADAVTH